jgi:nucleotide-binding universal stress UspA family protein
MVKRILVPTDGSDAAAVGVEYAVALAAKYGAALLGLHVVDVRLLEGPILRDLSASLGTAPYVNYEGNITALLEERGKAALAEFVQRCESAGVAHETALATGMVSRTIVQRADLCDMIVMGRGGEHSEWLEGLIGSTTEAVVRRAAQPVLVTGTAVPSDRRFLVAYDGSRHARHALRTAVAIAADWKVPFHLLLVGDQRMDEVEADARAYLQAYDVAVEYVRREGEPGDVIVAYAAECQADLLVMGAYGHSKVRELVVGSTTTFAINHAPCPVLLSR